MANAEEPVSTMTSKCCGGVPVGTKPVDTRSKSKHKGRDGIDYGANNEETAECLRIRMS